MYESELPLFKWDEFFDDKDDIKKEFNPKALSIQNEIENTTSKKFFVIDFDDSEYFIKFSTSSLINEVQIYERFYNQIDPDYTMYFPQYYGYLIKDKNKKINCEKSTEAIIMQYIKGKTLYDKLSEKDNKLNVKKIFETILMIFDKNPFFYHGDLHLKNIMIDDDYHFPYIIDYEDIVFLDTSIKLVCNQDTNISIDIVTLCDRLQHYDFFFKTLYDDIKSTNITNMEERKSFINYCQKKLYSTYRSKSMSKSMSTFCRTNNSSICNMTMGRSKSKSKSKSNICNTVYTLIKGNIQKPIKELVWNDIFITISAASNLQDPKITTKIMIKNKPYFIKYCCSTCMDDLFYEFLVGAILTKIGLPHIPKVYMYFSETETFHYDDENLFSKENIHKQYCAKKQHAILEEYIKGNPISIIDDKKRKIEILKKIVDLQTQYPYIIHNDLHINNILIDKKNNPYLIDLGRVRLIHYKLPNEVQSEFNLLDKMIQKYSTNNCFFNLYDYKSTLELLQNNKIGVFNQFIKSNFYLYPLLKYCCNFQTIDKRHFEILTQNINTVESENHLFQLLISNIKTLLKGFNRNRSKSITKTHKRNYKSVKNSVSKHNKSKTRKIFKNPKPWIPPGRRIT